MLAKADIKKMQRLYKRRYGIDLDRDEAYRKLALIVRQMELIYRPITKAQLKALQDEGNKANVKNEGTDVSTRPTSI